MAPVPSKALRSSPWLKTRRRMGPWRLPPCSLGIVGGTGCPRPVINPQTSSSHTLSAGPSVLRLKDQCTHT